MNKSECLKIAIFGADGQLGSELVRQLEAVQNVQVVQSEQSAQGEQSAYTGAQVKKFSHKCCDISSKDQVANCLDNPNSGNANFDIIFNCAAMTDVDLCESEEKKAFAVNEKGAQNIAYFAHLTGAKLVHISTDYVFDGCTKTPYTEACATNPQSVYGASKLVGETAVQKNCERNFIVRCAWLYGQGENNFPTKIMRTAKKNSEIKVVNDQFGSPSYTKDVACALLTLALGNSYGVYHCTNSGACSWFDFACAIVDKAHIPCTKLACSSQEYVRPAKRPAYSVLDSTKLEDTIGCKMRTWQQALDDYLCAQNVLR